MISAFTYSLVFPSVIDKRQHVRTYVLVKKARRKHESIKAGAYLSGVERGERSINLIKPIHSPSFRRATSVRSDERVDRRNGPFTNTKEFDFPRQALHVHAFVTTRRNIL